MDLPDAAVGSGTSKRTLSWLLDAETGLTWAQTLRRLRTIRAVERLARREDGDEQITQIAFASGYASLSAFERAFPELTGLTPTVFRARHDEDSTCSPHPPSNET